ncbi:MAG TPA: hypothetical protein VFY89_05535 [Ktedonobacterales bacterium]
MSPRPCARVRIMTAMSLLLMASVVSFTLGVEAQHMTRLLVPPQRPVPPVSQRATGAIGAPIPPPPPRRGAVVKSTPRPPAEVYAASGARRARPPTARARHSTTSAAALRCQRQGGEWSQITQVMALPQGTQRLVTSFCVGAAVAAEPPVLTPPITMPSPPDLVGFSVRVPPPPPMPSPPPLPPPWAAMPGSPAFAPPAPPPPPRPPSPPPMPMPPMPMPPMPMPPMPPMPDMPAP